MDHTTDAADRIVTVTAQVKRKGGIFEKIERQYSAADLAEVARINDERFFMPNADREAKLSAYWRSRWSLNSPKSKWRWKYIGLLVPQEYERNERDDREAPWTMRFHLNDVAIRVDGSIDNPWGYPEALTRREVERVAAEKTAEIAANRKRGAAEAAKTRADRHQLQVDYVAHRIVEGKLCGPRVSCCLCLKQLTDAESVERGIGSDCWQSVLRGIEAIKANGYIHPRDKSLSAWIMKQFGAEVRAG